MKFVTFAAAFLAVLVAASCDDNCKEGETKMQDCNHCVCTDGFWGCTLKACQHEPHSTENHCRPGDKKKEDCNSCVCTGSGTWACTQIGCLRKRQAEQCNPGDKTRDKCSSCTCQEGGIWLCERNRCTR